MQSTLAQTQLPHRISLSQAARLSGYHQDYLGQLCRLGKLRAAKIGRNWYTTQSELQTLVNNSEAYGVLDQFVITPDETTDETTDESGNIEDQSESLEPAMQVPVVASNYVISEVDAMPIRLEERPQVANSHHSIQTLITRMKLEELKSEVMQFAGIIDQISDEVLNHTEILKRHELLLESRTNLRDVYSSSLEIGAQPRVVRTSQVEMFDGANQNLNNDNFESVKSIWLWPALALLLAVTVSSLFIFSISSSSVQPELSTVIYQPQQGTKIEPQVAGAQVTDPANESLEVGVPLQNLISE